MSNFVLYRLLDACREAGCPVCRVEQHAVERYLENQFYENVNSPKWRDRLRASLGFCREHAWLAVDRRLGDALGFSIIYRDVLNHILRTLEEGRSPPRSSRHWSAVLRQTPEGTRTLLERILYALTPGKPCPVCEHREETTRTILSVLVEALTTPQMVEALRSSDGMCLPHLQRVLEQIREVPAAESLLAIHRAKLEDLRSELEEFIRKNDYREIQEGFGTERDAWLRAIAMVMGSRARK